MNPLSVLALVSLYQLCPTLHHPSKCRLLSVIYQQQGLDAGAVLCAHSLLTKALQQLGLQVEILGFSDDEAPLSVDPSVTVKRFTKKTYPAFMSSAMRLVRSIEGELIYAYKTKASSFGVGLLAKRVRRLPLALDIDDWEMSWHGGETWRYRPSL
jgi:hypothetical protein